MVYILIESKNIYGKIYYSEDDTYQTIVYANRRKNTTYYKPVLQNKVHINTVIKIFSNINPNLYKQLKNRILELDDIDVEVKKLYIAFKGSRNIVDIGFNKNEIKVYINMKKDTLSDPLSITRDISKVGHWGNGDYGVILKNEEDIDNVIPLIKQSLKINKK